MEESGTEGCNEPFNPPILVADSFELAFLRSNTAAAAAAAAGEGGGGGGETQGATKGSPPAECFVEGSRRQPFRDTSTITSAPFPASTGIDTHYLLPAPVAADPATVLLSADSLSLGNAGELGSSGNRPDNGPDRVRTEDTPQKNHATCPRPSVPLSQLGNSNQFPLQSQLGSEQPLAVGKYSDSLVTVLPHPEAWRGLVREVAGSGREVASSTRPSLCSCKKLAVPGMLRVDGGDDDEAGDSHIARRPGRVCVNRGGEGGCSYKAFSDAPLVPSTTVSHITVKLILHRQKQNLVVSTLGSEGGDPNSGAGASSSGHAGTSGGAVEDKACSSALGAGETKNNASDGSVKAITVEIRKWLMDCVASVHCNDAALRKDMLRIIPPELGQSHASPDGSGQLIALHLAAVQLFVKSLATLPGVLKVDGADKATQVFSKPEATLPSTVVPSTAVTPARGPVDPRNIQGRPIAAPVPIRASDLIAPSILDLATGMGKRCVEGQGGVGDGGGDASTDCVTSASSLKACQAATSTASNTLMTNVGRTPPRVLEAGGYRSATGTVVNSSALFPTTPQLQRLQGWGNNTTAWHTVAKVSEGDFSPGDGCDTGRSIARTRTDSASRGVALGTVNRHGEEVSEHRQHVASRGIGGGTSSGFFTCQDAEAAAKRQRTGDFSHAPTTMAMTGLSMPVHQGYSSLLSDDTSESLGNDSGGAPAYSMSSVRSETSVSGIGFTGSDYNGLGVPEEFGEGSAGGEGIEGVDIGSAWIDAVFDGNAASSSTSNL